MMPQMAIAIEFARTALIDVVTAVQTPTSRSKSMGKDTTLRLNTTMAKRRPTPLPTAISVQPDGVARTSPANSIIDPGVARPKIFCVDAPRRAQPREVDHHQYGTEHRDGAQRWRPEDGKHVPPRTIETLLAASAQLIHADREDRADQGVSGKERKHEPQHVVSRVDPREDEGDDGINRAKENQVRWHRVEVGETLDQCVFEINQGNLVDDRSRRSVSARISHRLLARHGRTP